MVILLNNEYDVELDDRKDLSTVEVRREVEQSIRVMVTSFFYKRVGSITAVNAVEKLELQAKRVAQNSPYIENLEEVSAERVTPTSDSSDRRGGIKINIIYDTGNFDFTVTG